MSGRKPNMRRLSNGAYLVRSQAGFRKALKDFFEEHQLPRMREIDGYPKSYPSVVTLSFVYGWNEAKARCVPINRYVDWLKELVADLDKE